MNFSTIAKASNSAAFFDSLMENKNETNSLIELLRSHLPKDEVELTNDMKKDNEAQPLDTTPPQNFKI